MYLYVLPQHKLEFLDSAVRQELKDMQIVMEDMKLSIPKFKKVERTERIAKFQDACTCKLCISPNKTRVSLKKLFRNINIRKLQIQKK